jgi:hypothetical protein
MRPRNECVRESWIFDGQPWVPYPFENNLRYMPKEVQLKCLMGTAKAAASGPNGDTRRYSSLKCEVSVPSGESVDASRVLDQVVAGLIRADILKESDKDRVVSRYHRLVVYSYPIPTLDRDKALAVIQPALLSQNIYSRGRFGSWR